MKFWFDTEFIEDGKTIDLISIGIVCEDGREYYAISKDFNESKASNWVKENVLAHLPKASIKAERFGPLTGKEFKIYPPEYKNREDIACEILHFIGYEKPEFWAYYAAYDWVVLCQLFGTMMDLPKGWPMYCRDIKQLCDSLGNPRLPEQGKGEHHALADARWNKLAYEFLINSANPPQA